MRTTIRFLDYISLDAVAVTTMDAGYIHVPRQGDYWLCRDVMTIVRNVITEYREQGDVVHSVLVGRVRDVANPTQPLKYDDQEARGER